MLLQMLMAGTRDNVQLLFMSQVDEFYRVAGYTNRKVCVFLFFRMLHCILQLFNTEYIDIQVMCTLIEIAVKDMN